jgi:4-carboxymuconolactone decarboxylase
MADPVPLGQGHAAGATERLPMPPLSSLDEAQRAAAQALIDGPRKGVYGPFVALLRSPVLLERMAGVGEYLRFDSVLDARIRELATCQAVRHAGNQFEWTMHAPLAISAGVAPEAIEAMRQGATPRPLAPDEEDAVDFARELLATHGVSDLAYRAALTRWGERGIVELTAIVGYFVAVSWLMNVARTPARAGPSAGLDAFPQ